MTPIPNSEEGARLARGYALGTLSDADRARVELLLADSLEWREALERERKSLGILDALATVEPPESLVRESMAVIEAKAAKAPPYRLVFALAGAAALVLIVIAAPIAYRLHESNLSAESRSNLKRIGMAFKMYAGENKDCYPPRAPYPDVWMFDIQRLYPEYLPDLTLLVDPSAPDAAANRRRIVALAARDPVDWEAITRIAARSYTYPGWVVNSEQDVAALGEGLKRLAKVDFERDLTVSGVTLRRPKEAVERFLITDINNAAGSAKAQSTIPLLFESSSRHRERGGVGANVLYMDGHVELIEHNRKFPVTESVQQTLHSK